MYVYGGITEDGYCNRMFALDCQSDPKWVSLPSSNNSTAQPDARAYHSMCAYGSEKIVVFGGECGYDCMDDLWLYETNTAKWTSIKRSEEQQQWPVARFQHSAFISRNFMFVVGGKDYLGKALSDVWMLDLTTWRWCEVASLPLPRAEHVLVSGKEKVYRKY